MKTTTAPIFLLLVFPFFLSAQDGDYCPCMEEENNYNMEFASVTRPDIAAFAPQPTLTYTEEVYFQQKEEEKAPQAPEKEEVDQSTDFDDDDLPEFEVLSKEEIRKKRKRTAKKRFKRKRKLKKKRNKYKGGCPAM